MRGTRRDVMDRFGEVLDLANRINSVLDGAPAEAALAAQLIAVKASIRANGFAAEQVRELQKIVDDLDAVVEVPW